MALLDFFTNDIGIDLGTANTLISVKGRGIVLNEPSVVALSRATGKVVAIGAEAKEMLGRTPDAIHAIRPLKDGVIADFETTEEMLRLFIRRVIRTQFLVKPRIVISVPSGITEVERRAVADSATNAGAREVFLVTEPMAAAVGVGIPVHESRGNMVIDIGGGTSEIAVVALSGTVNNVSIRIAGDELDESIINYLKKKYNLLVGYQTAEQIKMQIGNAYKLPEELTMDIKGRDLVDGLPKVLNISSVEIREALQEPVNSIMQALREALEQTPPELSSDIVDRGIIMTGGGAQLLGLDQRIRVETNLPVYVVDDPLLCVVRGTEKISNDLATFRELVFKGS
ncbi:MAG: rod shape-determining protein [Candidatus Zixiibacteriota bacterium]